MDTILVQYPEQKNTNWQELQQMENSIKQDLRMLTGLNWHKTVSSGELLWRR
jgi:hypothetical protein